MADSTGNERNAMTSNGPSDQALDAARNDQTNLELVNKVQSDELTDMERLQNIVTEHHTVALMWDRQGDKLMAQKARALEQQALNLLDRLAKLEGLSESEAQMLLDEIKGYLK